MISLAEAGYLPTSTALKIIEAYENEDDSTVWAGLATTLRKLLTLTAPQNKAVYDHIAAIVRRVTAPLVKKLGWDAAPGEDDQTAQLRTAVLGLAATVGDKDVISEAMKRFEHPEEVSADLRPLVYRVAAQAGEEQWNKLFAMFKAADLQETRLILARAMGAVGWCDNEPLLRRYYDWATYSGDIPAQDIHLSFRAAGAGNPDFAIRYLMENWEKVFGICGSTFTFIMAHLFEDSVAWAYSPEQLETIEKFFAGKDNLDVIQGILDKTYETIRITLNTNA